MHYFKKKRSKRCPFERYCGFSSSPRRAKQGKKKTFLPLSPPSLSSKRCRLLFKKTSTPPQLAHNFPRVGGAVEGRQLLKNRGRESKKEEQKGKKNIKKRGGKTKRENNEERREKRKGKQRKKRGKNRRGRRSN